ncbi:MAG: hypothetical protein HOP19_23625, partial [Acidobacteria bacterium]|nr:hypothetical protein [Acidobacteriota bacterium]
RQYDHPRYARTRHRPTRPSRADDSRRTNFQRRTLALNRRLSFAKALRSARVSVISTEPCQLIEDLNQSPFNVGEVINLDDFTAAQVNDLNERHGEPLNDGEVTCLMNLLNGHPYLTRRALYLVATDRLTVADFFSQATDERGPFGDHLRSHLFRTHDKAELIKGMCSALRNHSYDSEDTFFRLRGAGLVKRAGMQVERRCQLYADFSASI